VDIKQKLIAPGSLLEEDQIWITRQVHLRHDPDSDGLRLSGSFSFAPGKWCPLWIAFSKCFRLYSDYYVLSFIKYYLYNFFGLNLTKSVSGSKNHHHWVRRTGKVVKLSELRTYVFSHEHPVKRGLTQNFSLKFQTEELALSLSTILAKQGFSVVHVSPTENESDRIACAT
jgi:hypothetical protein